MDVKGIVSNSLRKGLFGLYYSSSAEKTIAPCYLIGQIAKEDSAQSAITGDILVDMALDVIEAAHVGVGGRFAKIDCENIPALIGLYARHGFRPVQRLGGGDMVEMVRFF